MTSSTPKTPVERHYYRCPECGVASHQPGDVQDEREIGCTICRTEGTAEYVSSREVTIPTHLVKSTDRVVMDFHSDVDPEDVSYHEGDRECPVCLKERVCSVREAQMVFRTGDWGATSMLEDADLVCSFCHSVQIDGTWERMETVDSRAYKLGQASSSKDSSDYRRILTRGIETGKEKPTADDAEGW